MMNLLLKKNRELNENENGVVAFDDVIEFKQKPLTHFVHEGDVKDQMCVFYPNPILIHRK